ncbi:hypothetical protein [Weissella ceti]|uniref:hypothetical protein n=1 Tax=Weissella ceti TaxID=759620 RepID=UPI001BCEE409|nr:hypothetical protein [Weissella ceti]QVK11371.1 hypothetical protein KHQ31_03880 [Weissella ceti]
MNNQTVSAEVSKSRFGVDDRETSISFLEASGRWSIYTNVRKHITKYLPRVTQFVSVEVDETGRVIKFYGYMDDIAGMSATTKREMTEEQRQALSDRAKKNFGK